MKIIKSKTWGKCEICHDEVSCLETIDKYGCEWIVCVPCFEAYTTIEEDMKELENDPFQDD